MKSGLNLINSTDESVPGSQSNLTMVPGVNWKVDLRPFEGVERAPQETTAREDMTDNETQHKL